MRKLNNITAVFCFTMAFAAVIGIITGAFHQAFMAAIAVVLGFAHLTDNSKPATK